MVEPASMSFETVIEPVKEPTDEPSQLIFAVPMLALPPAAAALPPTVACDFGPPSGQPSPLLPGPAAIAGAAAGRSRAVKTMLRTANHESRRAKRKRPLEREFDIAMIPEREEPSGSGWMNGFDRWLP